MKKILSICLMMALVVIMSVNAFAAPNGFVSSPSGTAAPDLVGATNESEDCTAGIIITPYSERDKLPKDVREKMEKAYEDIIDAADLTELNEDLAELAKEKGVDPEDLAVSDLFDISYSDCEEHDDHGHFDIVLKDSSLKGFVGLLHKNGDNWELVKDAKVKKVNGEWHLTFTTDDFAPFAIVVDTSASSSSPQTGDNSMINLYAAILAAVVFALIVLLIQSRKQKV